MVLKRWNYLSLRMNERQLCSRAMNFAVAPEEQFHRVSSLCSEYQRRGLLPLEFHSHLRMWRGIAYVESLWLWVATTCFRTLFCLLMMIQIRRINPIKQYFFEKKGGLCRNRYKKNYPLELFGRSSFCISNMCLCDEWGFFFGVGSFGIVRRLQDKPERICGIMMWIKQLYDTFNN